MINTKSALHKFKLQMFDKKQGQEEIILRYERPYKHSNRMVFDKT